MLPRTRGEARKREAATTRPVGHPAGHTCVKSQSAALGPVLTSHCNAAVPRLDIVTPRLPAYRAPVDAFVDRLAERAMRISKHWPMVLLLAAAGCGDDPAVTAPADPDAGVADTSPDAGPDLGTDAAEDTGALDGGPADTGADALPDDAPDTGTDAEPDAGEPVPVRTTMHRLNNAEYDNTVRDLLWTDQQPAESFPPDDIGYGFDNISDVLSMSPLHLEMYELAAQSLVAEALRVPIYEPLRFFVLGGDGEATTGGGSGDGWNLWSNGEWSMSTVLPEDGRYRVTLHAYGQQAGAEVVHGFLGIDSLPTFEFDMPETVDLPAFISTEFETTAGPHTFGAFFTNDYYNPDAGEDRNMIILDMTVEGPLDLRLPGEAPRDRLILCDPEVDDPRGCAIETLDAFLPRAWRRPVPSEERDRLMAIYDEVEGETGSFDQGLRWSFVASLVSPHFVFRVEPDPALDNVRPLNDYEVASRLSYFLWSSMPDEELFDLADRGELTDPDVLAEQVDRMLDDPRAIALVDNFAGQWLYIRDIRNVFPDIWIFPTFDDDLNEAMIEEMRLFFWSFITDESPMLELLTADYTYVNERLATHYGIEGMEGEEFARVSLAGLPRQGILTQAGLLTVLSTPTRTSLVRRGKWVLGQLLCSEPSAPPPGVEGLPEQTEDGGTLREILERHRADPVCATCHIEMDAIGFGLENYDGIGLYRLEDNGEPVDATGELAGQAFDDAISLSEILVEDARFARCISQKLYIYALGRGLGVGDLDPLNHVLEEFVDGGHSFRDLAALIATSDPFLFHSADRGEEDE